MFMYSLYAKLSLVYYYVITTVSMLLWSSLVYSYEYFYIFCKCFELGFPLYLYDTKAIGINFSFYVSYIKLLVCQINTSKCLYAYYFYKFDIYIYYKNNYYAFPFQINLKFLSKYTLLIYLLQLFVTSVNTSSTYIVSITHITMTKFYIYNG